MEQLRHRGGASQQFDQLGHRFKVFALSFVLSISRFTPLPIELGTTGPGAVVGLRSWVDYDNDGTLELLVSGIIWDGSPLGVWSRMARDDEPPGASSLHSARLVRLGQRRRSRLSPREQWRDAREFMTVVPVQDVSITSMGIESFSNGQPRLLLSGEPWRSYSLEASDDLVHWVRLTNVICTNLLTQWVDPDAPNHSQRFYRSALLVAAPQLSLAPLEDNQFQFLISGEIGRNLQIQASTDLVNWSPLTNVVPTTAPMLFGDGDAWKLLRRFYRIISY